MDDNSKTVVQSFIIAVIAVISVGALFANGNAMTRIDKLEKRIDKLEKRIDKLETTVEILRESCRKQVIVIREGMEK